VYVLCKLDDRRGKRWKVIGGGTHAPEVLMGLFDGKGRHYPATNVDWQPDPDDPDGLLGFVDGDLIFKICPSRVRY
jgi:hypothetical protein